MKPIYTCETKTTVAATYIATYIRTKLNIPVRLKEATMTRKSIINVMIASSIDCQDRVNRAFGDKNQWTRMSLLNVARIGKFSSDRAFREYCLDIWHAAPCSDTMEWQAILENGVVFPRRKSK